jgi:hypothetical protein
VGSSSFTLLPWLLWSGSLLKSLDLSMDLPRVHVCIPLFVHGNDVMLQVSYFCFAS